jgi:hypothetical protein
MAGSGGPNPKGKQIDDAKVIELEDRLVSFSMEPEDAIYFKKDKSYRLIAIEKD